MDCSHTDFVNGKITTHGQMIQLGTLCQFPHPRRARTQHAKLTLDLPAYRLADDNAGAQAEWVAPETARDIYKAYPREGWTGCFTHAMKEEVAAKPWS